MTASVASDQTDSFEVHAKVETADETAVELLHRASKLSKNTVKTAMNCGAVWITRGNQSQRLRRAKRTLQPGDELHLYYNPTVLAEQPPEPELITDMGGYTVWYKPSGMRSQGSKWGDHCTIMRWAEQHLEPQRASFTVHRLDLAASGLIIVAHSKVMAAAFGQLFRERHIEKHYRALVVGDISHVIKNNDKPLRIDTEIDGKAALSEVDCIAVSDDKAYSLLTIRIETGRKHQIRRHLCGIGHPIVGDRLHGDAQEGDPDLQLTACRLAFSCPVSGDAMSIALPSHQLPQLPAA